MTEFHRNAIDLACESLGASRHKTTQSWIRSRPKLVKIKQIQKFYDRLLQSESVCTDLGIQSYSGYKGEFQVYQIDYFITNAKIIYLSLVIRIQKSKVLITPLERFSYCSK